MKQLSVLFLLLCAASAVQAQDVIVKKDGSTILSKVLEVNTADVKYKKFSNQQGPTYTISTSELQAINYENGEKDTFISEPKSAPDIAVEDANSGSTQFVKKTADAHNAELIDSYNNECHSTGKWENDVKPMKCGYAIYNVSPSSLMSNDEIEMSFVKKYEGVWFYYVITLKNKTDRILYVDLANSFRTCSSGETRCYFESKQTTVSQGSTSGASVGLGAVAGALGVGGAIGQITGGVAVGGGTSNSVSTTYIQQQVITIPPHGQRVLAENKTAKVKRYTYEQISEAEDFQKITKGVEGVVHAGEATFDENSSPFTVDYSITYSTSNNFATYSTLSAKLFIKTVVGTKYSFHSLKMAGWTTSMYEKIDKYVSGIDGKNILCLVYDM